MYLADIDAGMREQRRLQALLDKVRARRAAFEAEAKARAEADAVEDAPKAGAGASAAQPPVRHFAVGTAGVRSRRWHRGSDRDTSTFLRGLSVDA